MAADPSGRLAQLEGSRDAGRVSSIAQSLIMMPDAAIQGIANRIYFTTTSRSTKQDRTYANACGAYYDLPKASTFASASRAGLLQYADHASASAIRFLNLVPRL
jgi:hypothetical protein